MSFVKGLLASRAHAAFLLGLALAVSIVLIADSWEERVGAPLARSLSERLGLDSTAPTPKKAREALTPREQEWARVAWRYFETNTQTATGLVNATDQYPSTTLWDAGSSILGLVAAEELGVIDHASLGPRLERVLDALARLPLVDGALPNKAYHTATLHPVAYDNSEAPAGVGWSALDLGRLAVAFTVVSWTHPEDTPRIRKILASWRMERLALDGRLQGASRLASGLLREVRETSFGYEAYAAKGLFLVGVDTGRSRQLDPRVPVTPVSGQLVAHNPPQPGGASGGHDAVVSEPFMLEGLEFGWDDTTLPLAQAVLSAQIKRRAQTGVLTAVSEDNIDVAPYFVYGSVIDRGRPWASVAPDGSDASAHRSFSVKAAMGWAYLFSGPYSDELLAGVAGLYDPERGFYAGRYEAGGATNKALTVNTNSVVLEVLAYKTRGPLLRAAAREP